MHSLIFGSKWPRPITFGLLDLSMTHHHLNGIIMQLKASKEVEGSISNKFAPGQCKELCETPKLYDPSMLPQQKKKNGILIIKRLSDNL